MMPELMLLGYPLSTLFLYFCFYSCAGWCMETVYCSILEKRFVPRGFLHGPLCPIYGVGVLLMILFFAPLKGNLALFYIVSTVVMSAWEYFVGWFLEVTTHIKYWDYSMYRFNLKGRICLWSVWCGACCPMCASSGSTRRWRLSSPRSPCSPGRSSPSFWPWRCWRMPSPPSASWP